MKISCVIVDDEPKACQLLVGLLRQIPDVEVLESFTDPFEARLYVMDSNPDMVLLDINMPGLSGLEFLDSIKRARIPSEVVFVTGFDHYTVDAIRKDAFDYLLKPVSLDDLVEMICRYRGRLSRKPVQQDICYGKLKFNTLQGFFLLDVSDIVYAQADGNYSVVYLNDGTTKIITQNLGSIDERLADFSFFRMDRSIIINLKYLVHINRREQACTLAFNGASIDFLVNRNRLKQLIDLF